MGIYANIYDSESGRDSLSVWPASVHRVLVINAEGPFERKEGEAAVMIVPAHGGRGCVMAVPVNEAGEKWPGVMKGYSYVASSDSRFSELVERISGHPFYGAVSLHDRCEW